MEGTPSPRKAGPKLAPLKVVVDTLAVQPAAGGIRVYLRELIRHVPPESARFTLICSRSNVEAFRDLDVVIAVVPWSTRSRVVRILTQQLLLPVLNVWLRPQVFFAPVDIAPLAVTSPLVACVHSSHLNAQAGYSRTLQSVYNRLFVGATMRRSRVVIAISGFVAQETARLHPVAASKLNVVYHGAGLVERLAGVKPRAEEPQREGGILFVGTLHPHKKVDVLLRAYARLREMQASMALPPLIIAGHDPSGMLPSLRQAAAELGIGERVQFVGRVDDGELLTLYRSSRVLAMPSVVEGFGLPVIEAMQLGLPVIVVDACALPEVAGDAALIIPADDSAKLAEALAEALWNPTQRQLMVERGRARGADFSWPRAAGATVAVLRQAAGAT